MARKLLVPLLLGLLIVLSSVPTASGHYKDYKIEIYRAITIPDIDGKYDMRLREVVVDGEKKLVDEWNDATWIEIPRRLGNVTAYSGYKHDGEFLYIVTDVVSVTNASFNYRASAGTVFDPKHDGGTRQTKPDDFVVLLRWLSEKEGFGVFVRYGSPKQYWGDFQAAPEGLVARSTLSATPYSLTPHLFYEVRVPLNLGDLRKYMDATIGISQEAYNENREGTSDNLYPVNYELGGALGADAWADATFSRATNRNPTVPPALAFVTTKYPPVIVTDYSFYRGDLDSKYRPVTRVNGYLRNETWASIWLAVTYLADMPEVVGVARFYGLGSDPDRALFGYQVGPFEPRKAGDSSIWTFRGEIGIGLAKTGAGMWRVEMYNGPYLLFVEWFSVGDYFVDVSVAGLPSQYAAKVLIDGKEAGTIRAGEKKPSALTKGTHSISVSSIMDGTGTRYTPGNSPRTVSSQTSELFEYRTQYYLKVESPFGNPSGEGWYDKGSTAVVSVTPSVTFSNGTQMLFVGWSGDLTSSDSSTKVVMDRPYSVVAEWRTERPSRSTPAQFYLKVQSPFGECRGEGQYHESDMATFSVSPTRIRGVEPLVDAVFVGWTGASTSREATATIVMDSDKTVTAVWSKDYGGLYFISMVVGVVVVVCLSLAMIRRHRRRKK